jgi:hypothetical protein
MYKIDPLLDMLLASQLDPAYPEKDYRWMSAGDPLSAEVYFYSTDISICPFRNIGNENMGS